MYVAACRPHDSYGCTALELHRCIVADFLNGECSDVHIHLSRIDIEDVPYAENDVREFLIERFTEKNELLEEFFKSGRFPAPSFEAPGQNFLYFLQSATVTLAATLLGVTSTGLTVLPTFLGVPLVAGYAHVLHQMIFE